MAQLTAQLQDSLVYADRDFLAGRYEIVSGHSPASQITRTRAGRAGAAPTVFTAQASAVETRTFALSSLAMLAHVLPALADAGTLDPRQFRRGMTSKIGWVEAQLSMIGLPLARGPDGAEVPSRSQGCFVLESGSQLKLVLITSPDDFASGIDALPRLHKLATKDVALPVRALVRVLAAQGYAGSWVAVPYLMLERQTAGHA